MATNKTSDALLKEQADQIMEMAESSGLQENYFFKTTFDRYMTQVEVLHQALQILTYFVHFSSQTF